jgi:predicted nucleotidyltransferase
MNIHFTNTKLFEDLRAATLVEVEIGSKMYGLEHKDSDTDLLCIYGTSNRELNSFFRTHHQLQFKKDKKDYIFVNIHTFLSNCLGGDSTINMEVICEGVLAETSLAFLYNMRYAFYNYKIMRSYLGMAKRDLKQLRLCNSEFETNRKVAHALRGYWFAGKLMRHEELKFTAEEIAYIKEEIWPLKGYQARNKVVSNLNEDIDSTRKLLNSELNKGTYPSFMNKTSQATIHRELQKLIASDSYQKMEDFEMSMIYEANENGVNY